MRLVQPLARPLLLAALSFLAASAVNAGETAWHPVSQGCHAQSLGDSLASWPSSPHSIASLRIAVAPDTGRGPAIVVGLDKGLHRALQADGQPVLIAAVGDGQRTCVHRMPLSSCAAAPAARSELASQQIPVSHKFDGDFVIRTHATRYHFQWSDGSGANNAVAFDDPDHPVAAAVAKAVKDLEACWAPAMAAFREGR